jgi:hypothetical protein
VQKFQISEVAEARLLLSLLQISEVSEASESTRFSQFRFFLSAMALSAFNNSFVKNSFVTRMEFRRWLKQTMDDDASSTIQEFVENTERHCTLYHHPQN